MPRRSTPYPRSTPSPRSKPRRLPAAALLPLVLLLGAGCHQVAGSDDEGAGGGSVGPVEVAVTITDEKCSAEPAQVPAGAATFRIKNSDAARVTEAELINGAGRILGERENLTPGLSGTFSLRLEPGRYSLYCPGAETETVAFTVTGKGPDKPSEPSGQGDLLEQAVSSYAAYVKDQTRQLVAATGKFTDAVRAGDLAKAKKLYGPARVYYERIEPVAESFGDLDPAIDARIGDVADRSHWTGFHPLEQALWQRGTTDGLTALADGLDRNVAKLDKLVQHTTYQPADLANGASSLLDEVANSKITGEEEHYSHLDLLDFWANVDGARRAFELLRPALERTDKQLASTIDARFSAVDHGLAPYRRGTSFASYTALSKSEVKQLATKVDALAEPLSTVAAKVVSTS